MESLGSDYFKLIYIDISQNTVFINQKYMIHPIFYLRAIKYEYLTREIYERWGAIDTQNPYLESINTIDHFV
jgi:hypothetical protein